MPMFSPTAGGGRVSPTRARSPGARSTVSRTSHVAPERYVYVGRDPAEVEAEIAAAEAAAEAEAAEAAARERPLGEAEYLCESHHDRFAQALESAREALEDQQLTARLSVWSDDTDGALLGACTACTYRCHPSNGGSTLTTREHVCGHDTVTR